METVTDLIFLGSKIIADGNCSHDIKTPLSNNHFELLTTEYPAMSDAHVNKLVCFPLVNVFCQSNLLGPSQRTWEGGKNKVLSLLKDTCSLEEKL